MDENQTDQFPEEGLVEIPIVVTPLVKGRAPQPVVTLQVGEQEALIEPTKARQIGAWLLESAAAAEMDAFLVAFLTRRGGLNLPAAMTVLREFRRQREERGQVDELAGDGNGNGSGQAPPS